MEVVSFLVELRKFMDHNEVGRSEEYAIRRFWCDWIGHTDKNQNLADLKETLARLDTSCQERREQSSPNPHQHILVKPLTGNQKVAYTMLMDSVFKALADPTRRLILDTLSEEDNQTLFELRTRLIMEHNVDMSRQAITKHLAILEQVGLVTAARSGRYKQLHLNRQPLSEIAQWLEKYRSN
jgi:DNA-binding transcriptional ArsR family regulator